MDSGTVIGLVVAGWAGGAMTGYGAASLRRLRRDDRRPEARGAGWQKPVAPPPEGSRPPGLPPRDDLTRSHALRAVRAEEARRGRALTPDEIRWVLAARFPAQSFLVERQADGRIELAPIHF